MHKLENKNIVITGASSGIGEKIAYKVAELGARPIMLARSKEKLEDICGKIKKNTSQKCIYYQLDVSEYAQVKVVIKQILEEVGQIDILLNNAGFGIFDLFHEAKLEDIENMFKVNVIGLMACTKEVLPSMIENHSGHIINVASQAGKIATPKSSIYSATKHAVLGYTNALRLELADYNIHVTAINPGPIDTNFFTIADKKGIYVKNIQRFMLQPDYVAKKIVDAMLTRKREINLPGWMNVGSVMYALFPSLFERLGKRAFRQK